MGQFGRFVRSKAFSVLFFIVLLWANWYVYRKFRVVGQWLGSDGPGLWLLGLLLVIFVVYALVRGSESPSPVRKWLMYFGGIYTCYFLYLVLNLLLFHVLAWMLEWIIPTGLWAPLGVFAAIIAAGLICVYGVLHGREVKTVRYSANVGTSSGNQFRIVLLSDVHLGVYNNERHLSKIVEAVNREQPDLVVIAGDLFDGHEARAYVDQNAASEQLRRILAKEGIVMATGNHDPATNDPEFRSFLRRSKVELLTDCGLLLGPAVVIGRNDSISTREPDCRRPLQSIVSGYQNYALRIIVDHNPQGLAEALDCGADLVLCGHTHRGQLFPINFFTKWAYGTERFWGHHQVGKTHVIVSAGCSVFQLPVRVATDNEVVVVDLSF